jgi:DNA-binding MarR family transcriptional regulator
VTDPDRTTEVAAALERVVPVLWDTYFTPLPPGLVADLPLGQARTLTHLSVVGQRRMGELAEDLGVKLPTATGIVDRLVERGLVQRSASDEDRRVVWVRPTAEGEAIAEAARRFRREIIVGRLARLDEGQRASVLRALSLLEVVAGPAPPPAR